MIDIVDIHTHTIASGHAFNTLYEMAHSAAEKGVKLFGISDHGPALEGSCSKIYFIGGNKIPKELFGMRLIFGCEYNILDFEGNVDLDETYSKNIHYAIASLHDVCIKTGTCKENTFSYIKAIEKNSKIKIIGHPDDGHFEVDMDVLAKAAHDNNVVIELNEKSVTPVTYREESRKNAYRMLEACVKYGTKIVVSSDAHIEYEVLDHTYANKLLEEIKFPQELVLNSSVEKTLAALGIK